MSSKKKQIRAKFRSDVFKRDGYKCKICGCTTGKLDAHHITNREEIINGGYVKENGITLCDPECHGKAESGEISAGKLYALINSSYELAANKASKLK